MSHKRLIGLDNFENVFIFMQYGNNVKCWNSAGRFKLQVCTASRTIRKCYKNLNRCLYAKKLCFSSPTIYHKYSSDMIMQFWFFLCLVLCWWISVAKWYVQLIWLRDKSIFYFHNLHTRFPHEFLFDYHFDFFFCIGWVYPMILEYTSIYL